MTWWTMAAQGVATSLLGWTAGTQVFALQHHYAAVLGAPCLRFGVVQFYTPLQGVRWTHWWLWDHPAMFVGAGVAGGVVVGAVAVSRWLQARQALQTPPAPQATWATTRTLRQAGLLRPGGPVIGKRGGQIVRAHRPGHCFWVASTQSGKTTCGVVPTILDDDPEQPHSMIINDPKDEDPTLPGGELYTMTAGWRATFTKVIRFQPLRADSHQCNPLDNLRLYKPQEIRDLQIVAEMLTNPDGDDVSKQSEASQHFMHNAEDMHVGVLAHGLYTRQATTLGAFYELWCGDLKIADLIAAMAATRHVNGQCHPAVIKAVRLFRETADRELSALINTARRALRLWADPLVCRATARSDFTLRLLRESVRPTTLYLNFPFSDIERLRPLSRLILRQCLEHAASRKGGWNFPLLAMLDEFQSLRRLPLLRHLLNYALGTGVTLCLITPSLNEIIDIWGEKHPFLEGCSTKVAFGIRDGRVADRFTDAIGSTETMRTRQSWSQTSSLWDRRRTDSTEAREEPLVSRTAVLKLDPGNVLAQVGEQTALLTKAYYKHHRVWRQRSLIPAPRT
jgi:type IV secretion system protein VirD4